MIRRAVIVVTLALLSLAGAASATALSVRPDAVAGDAPTAGSAEGPVTVELATFGPAVLTGDGAVSASVSVANSSFASLSNLSVVMAVTQEPLTSSSQLQSFLDDPGGVATTPATSVPVATAQVSGTGYVLGPNGTANVNVAASAQALALPPHTSGVYGVVLRVENPGGVLAQRAALFTWYDAPMTPLRVALLGTASGNAGRVASVAAAVSVRGAALLLDPVTVTDEAQASALAADRELYRLPTGNPDLTSLAHAEDSSLTAFAVADSATNTAPQLRGLPWIAPIPVLDAPTIALAAQHGATAGMLGSAAAAALGAHAPVVDVVAGDARLAVLNPDRQLSTILASYRPGLPDAAARLVAEAAIEAQDGAGTVVVAPGEQWQLTAPGASSSVAELLSAPWVMPVTVRSVLGGDARQEVTAKDSTGTADDFSADLITVLARQLEDVTQLSRTAADPDTVLLPAGRALLTPLAAALRTDDEARTAAFAAARDTVNATLGAVYVAEGSDVNLIAASGKVPVTLHNDLDVDATVTVVMRSSSPNLVIQDRPVVTIPAGSDVTALISVTGVKSANVTTTVALHNAEGDVIAAPQALRVRVRADWGNAMTAVFTAGLGVLMIAGIVRTIRRGRRSSRMAPVVPVVPGHTGAGGDDG